MTTQGSNEPISDNCEIVPTPKSDTAVAKDRLIYKNCKIYWLQLDSLCIRDVLLTLKSENPIDRETICDAILPKACLPNVLKEFMITATVRVLLGTSGLTIGPMLMDQTIRFVCLIESPKTAKFK